MLLKPGLEIEAPETFIDDFSDERQIPLDKGELDAILYLRKGAIKRPDWAKTFQSKIGGADLSEIIPGNQSAGATLYLKVRNRIFAINWGLLARYNTIRTCVDRKFGIYTANKLFNEGNGDTTLKSAQSRVNETNPVNKQRHYGASVSNSELLLSMEDNEALQELTVLNSKSDDFYRLIGKYTALNVQFIFEKTETPCLQHLPAKLAKLLDIYLSVTQDDVKKLFKGIYPKDDGLDQLFLELENKIAQEPESFFLFEPEIDFDLSQVSQFRIETDTNENISEELVWQNYLDLKPAPNQADLLNDSIHILDEEQRAIKTWSVLDCLYGEIEVAGINYIISRGEWFEVNHDKYARVNTTIDNILDNTLVVPDAVKNQTRQSIAAFVQANPNSKLDKERIFNRHFCTHLDGELFDEIAKQIVLYEDQFEVCDILLPLEKKFLHVKNNYSASALSHLFNQGFVSASSFARYTEDYLLKINAHIPDPVRHLTNNGAEPCVHYLLINDKKENRLTFFSKMALEDRVSTLSAMGFSVKLSWVRDVY